MTRPSYLLIDANALKNNIIVIKKYAAQQKILAMVKSNAYGCGLHLVVPILEPLVDALGVACLEEAYVLRQISPQKECILMQGIFSPNELSSVVEMQLTTVIHNPHQLAWFTNIPQSQKLKVWIKVDTGMHRLGFKPRELSGVLKTLKACPWIEDSIGLMTHMACADTPEHPVCKQQMKNWQLLAQQYTNMKQSVANSAAVIALPQSHADVIRPGLILYGASPFQDRSAEDLGLEPVMHFISSVTTIHEYAKGETVGYGAIWQCQRPSVIGVIPVGYGDGYPRHISSDAMVWLNGQYVPIVGRVSMDMITVDLTDCPKVNLGDQVELWGRNIPIEVVARQSNTIAYELMTQVSQRVLRQYKH